MLFLCSAANASKQWVGLVGGGAVPREFKKGYQRYWVEALYNVLAKKKAACQEEWAGTGHLDKIRTISLNHHIFINRSTLKALEETFEWFLPQGKLPKLLLGTEEHIELVVVGLCKAQGQSPRQTINLQLVKVCKDIDFDLMPTICSR